MWRNEGAGWGSGDGFFYMVERFFYLVRRNYTSQNRVPLWRKLSNKTQIEKPKPKPQ